MRHLRSSHSIFWLLFLLGAGSLLLLLHLEDLIRKTPPGVIRQVSQEKADMSAAANPSAPMTPKASVSELLRKTSVADSALPGWELQQQLEIQKQRHSRLANVCSEYQPGAMKQQVSDDHMANLFVEDQFRLLYCEVPKAGCSNWKRVLMVLSGKFSSVLNLTHDQVHTNAHLRHLKECGPNGVAERLENFTKVLFVREPFQRLVSGFRDKMENPNKPYHYVFGRDIIAKYRANASKSALETGDGVTFREFVQCVLDLQCSIENDPHWAPISQLCHPCLLQYHFIGKLENANTEGNFLLRHIGAPVNVSYPDYKDRHSQEERTSSAIMEKYFYQLNVTERQGIYDLYRMDYLMFGYPKPLPDLH